MSTSNEKIGSFIAEVRQERGLTQAEFAKRLGTSQSAVNRIEKGKQNLSLETLGRISGALNKQIITMGDNAVNLRINGGQELSGSVALKASKNAAVALLCASLLNHGVTRFNNFPKIEEVFRIIEVLESIGVSVKWDEANNLEIRRPEKLQLDKLNAASAKKTRSVIMLLGPLMHEFASFKIPYAGGCQLGRRTVEPHLFALEEFGVDIVATNSNYVVSSQPKAPGELTLYEAGNTVTNNALMAAALTPDTTKIYAASGDYMTQDLAYFLRELGVKIDGVGTPFLTVTGQKFIKKNVTFTPTEDPIEAMFFLAAAVVTDSKITIERVPFRWIGLEILKLRKMGVKLSIGKSYPAANGKIELADITVEKHNGKLTALTEKIHPNLWPGVNPDSLPYLVICATVCRGRTLIHDWIFENRAIYYTELTKIGGQIELVDPHRIYVHGPTKYKAADVVCPPALRPASLLLIGMLAADGTSTLRNVYTIRRGYEDLANRLNKLGADINVLNSL